MVVTSVLKVPNIDLVQNLYRFIIYYYGGKVSTDCKIFDFQPQGPGIDPQFCRNQLKISMVFLSAKAYLGHKRI